LLLQFWRRSLLPLRDSGYHHAQTSASDGGDGEDDADREAVFTPSRACLRRSNASRPVMTRGQKRKPSAISFCRRQPKTDCDGVPVGFTLGRPVAKASRQTNTACIGIADRERGIKETAPPADGVVVLRHHYRLGAEGTLEKCPTLQQDRDSGLLN
jgi:hypothetical protein